MSTLVVVFPRSQLSPKDKERLTKHGIVAVEADDPNQVRMLSIETCGIASNDVLRASLFALASGDAETSSGLITGAGRQKAEFVKQLSKAVQS